MNANKNLQSFIIKLIKEMDELELGHYLTKVSEDKRHNEVYFIMLNSEQKPRWNHTTLAFTRLLICFTNEYIVVIKTTATRDEEVIYYASLENTHPKMFAEFIKDNLNI